MEKNLLLFGFSRSAHGGLIEGLRGAGFGITATTSLTRLHILLSSRRFEAILVSERETFSHKISVTRHLWQVRIPVTALVIRRRGTVYAPSWSYTVHRGPDRETGRALALPECFAVLCETIRDAGTSAGTGYRHARLAAEKEGAYGGSALPGPLSLSGLHRMMAEVLTAIIGSGQAGIEAKALQCRLWPHRGRDRRKDLQIYVSKIRKRLDSAEPNRFAILYDKGRYRFCDRKGNRPSRGRLLAED